jgi:hypothetical protein
MSGPQILSNWAAPYREAPAEKVGTASGLLRPPTGGRAQFTQDGPGDGTTLLFGQTHTGHYLLVVLSGSGDGRWYVVTARSMTDSERRVYRRKAR